MASDPVQDFEAYLLEKGIPSSFISVFSGKYTHNRMKTLYRMFYILEQHMDEESFLELTEVEIKGLIKPLGIVKKLVILQKKVGTL